MIPSRRLAAVVLAVAGVAGLAMAAGSIAPRGQNPGPAGDAGTAGAEADLATTVPAGDAVAATRETQETSRRPLLPVYEYESPGMTAQEAIDAHAAATEGPEQPIPFNHRFHVREIGMQCAYCHGGVQSSSVAPIPSVDLCMGCHRIVGAQLVPIQDLRGYWDRGEPVPWERVYKVPDFVQFPHEAHLRNEVACSECHGPVEDMDRVYPVTDLRMGWCLECHMGEPQATDYATDYLLARDVERPRPPSPRQPVGLYPRTIDQMYGESRAPIDCTACHY